MTTAITVAAQGWRVWHLHRESSAFVEAEQLCPSRLQQTHSVDAVLKGLRSKVKLAHARLDCNSHSGRYLKHESVVKHLLCRALHKSPDAAA